MRLLRLARPLGAALALAVAGGRRGHGMRIALLAVSGFLLARASQHPDIIAICAAAVVWSGRCPSAAACSATLSGWPPTTSPSGCSPTSASRPTDGWNGWPRPG